MEFEETGEGPTWLGWGCGLDNQAAGTSVESHIPWEQLHVASVWRGRHEGKCPRPSFVGRGEKGERERERERQVESKLQEREREGEKHQRKQIKAWVLHGSSIRDPLSFSRFQW